MDTKAAFEKWFDEAYGTEYIVDRDDDTGHAFKMMAWQGWLASRAAIEVELDGEACHSDEYFCDGYRIATEAAEEAITSHGIRIKGKTE